LNPRDFSDLAGKTLAVPLRYSGHNICALQLAEKFGISGADLKIVEKNPPDMASALAAGALDAYFVGEPFAAKTVISGEAKVLHHVSEVWPGFICNLLVVKNDFIERHADWAQMLVQAAARSGFWARNHPKAAAEIAAGYWNQPFSLVEYALQNPPNMIVHDRFIPIHDEIQYLADQMVRFHLLAGNDIAGLVDDRFARNADMNDVSDFKSIVKPRP